VTKIFRKKRKTTSGSGYFDELGNVQHIQVRTNSKQFHWTHLSLSKRKKTFTREEIYDNTDDFFHLFVYIC